MVQRYEQTRKLQWYKRGAAYLDLSLAIYGDQLLLSMVTSFRLQ